MAVGDAAAAAGLPILTGAEDLRDGWVEINRTRDQVAAVMRSQRQLDTTNSEVVMVQQAGIGMIAGAAASVISEAVVFPVAFKASSFPIVVVSFIGQVAGAFNPSAAASSAGVTCRASVASPTGFTAYVQKESSLSAGTNYYYSYIVIGEPA